MLFLAAGSQRAVGIFLADDCLHALGVADVRALQGRTITVRGLLRDDPDGVGFDLSVTRPDHVQLEP